MQIMQIAHVDATREFRSLLSNLYLSIVVVGTPGIPTEAAKARLVAQLVEEVVALYSENHREYHDIRHPVSMWHLVLMLKQAGKLDSRVDERLLLLLILLHDVIVKLGRRHGWNEWMSAELAERQLRLLGAEDTFINALYYGITCSIHHTIDPELKEDKPWIWHTIACFLDLDLFGLGQNQKSFALDTERVWKEFCAVATRGEYNYGRTQWASSFLQRERIYHTEVFQHLEAPARQNLTDLRGPAA